MDTIQTRIEEKEKVIIVMCDADKRGNLLRFLGEADMQYLSPTLDDFEKAFKTICEEDRRNNEK
ncbi:hypothetical protein SAMN05660742_11194 [Propionispira arboris]|uniref:Uncharacterized protein n=1 Tax=Propionispira arboris TaxID=84035 RepID=A0A1H7ACV6_9FIRM|nr:hypothetical protein [Propionispira arboris]SEJ59902.1 hypothetical protein SAMN05660742_11194 [Propionispira arboris]